MSNKTVETMAYMTAQREVRDLLCHDVLVSRVACTLNNHLLKLTGRRMGELKVDDPDKVGFRPRELVRHICAVYANLGGKDEFCKAVSQDGRSFSDELFPRAVAVLRRINSSELVPAMESINNKASVCVCLYVCLNWSFKVF